MNIVVKGDDCRMTAVQHGEDYRLAIAGRAHTEAIVLTAAQLEALAFDILKALGFNV